MKIDVAQKTILLETCHDSALLSRWEYELESSYTKRELTEILKSVTEAFPGHSFRLSDDGWALRIEPLIRSNTPKADLVEMTAKIFASPSNRELLTHILTDAQKEMWQGIYTQVYLPVADAERIIGKKLLERRALYFNTYNFTVEAPGDLVWVKPTNLDWRSSSVLIIPDFFRKAFGTLFTPVLPDRSTVAEETVTYNAEFAVLSGLPVLRTIYLSGGLNMGRYRLQATVVNRLFKQLNFPPFPSSDGDAMTRKLSTWMVANAYALHTYDSNLHKGNASAREAEIRQIVGTLLQMSSVVFPIVAGFLDKATQAVLDRSTYPTVLTAVKEYILARPAGEWIDADGLLMELYSMPDINETFKLLSEKAFADSYVANIRNSGLIRYANVAQYLTFPAALGTVALFASLGLVELEMTAADELDPSPLWGLRRLRLTPLGAYAFKLTNTYEAPVIEDCVYFEADPERLMIRALGETNPYEGLITEYLKPVGGRRFVATPALMLARCHGLRDLDTRISEFKALVGKTLPKNWEAFFDELRANWGKIKKTPVAYVTLSVNPEDRALQRLVTTDPEIRKLSLRAENYMLLVPTDQFERFRQLLAEHGYLM